MVTNKPPYSNPYAPVVKQRARRFDPREDFGNPSVLVVEEFKNQKSQVDVPLFGEDKPEVPFSACFFLANHDPRLYLSADTYVQMIMAAGLKIKIKQKSLNKKVNKWVDKIELEKKTEDALYSLLECGNAMFEKAPGLADIAEIDMATVIAAKRTEQGKIQKYIQEVNMKPNPLDPKDIIHFKLTNVRREVWGRGLFHALISVKTVDGISMDAPIVSQWKMEDAMVKIFEGYASPMMMIHFKDAGEEWIKRQETAFKKMEQGKKILTDKEFDAKIFEVAPQAKFDKYVEHRQSNIMEPGSQFPLGFFNADYTNRNAAEITDSVLGRKIKRIQKRVAKQIKKDIIIPYIKMLGDSVEDDDVVVAFELESKSEIGNQELAVLFEKGVLSRSEFRRHIMKKTTVELDEDDMADTPPITSVTPTNDLRTTQPSPAAQAVTPIQQQDQIAQLQQQIEKLQEAIQTKIPNPRGRPKNNTSSN